jgi:sporulation protein YlmC with PRC-barrel domain
MLNSNKSFKIRRRIIMATIIKREIITTTNSLTIGALEEVIISIKRGLMEEIKTKEEAIEIIIEAEMTDSKEEEAELEGITVDGVKKMM